MLDNQKNMKVGIDGRYAEENLLGIGNYIKNLAQDYYKKGIKCIIFYSKEPKYKIKGSKSIVLNISNRYLFEQFYIPFALKKHKVDIYHATGNTGVPIFSSLPVVLTIHDIIPMSFKDYFKFSRFPFLSKNLYKLNLFISCYKAKKIISVSKFVKKEIIKKIRIPENKIKVIYSGIIPLVQGELPSILIGKKYILNHGGIDIRKNLEKLIKSFYKAYPKISNYKLVITGSNPRLEKKLKSLVKKINLEKSVIFMGYVSDKTLGSILKNAKCICYPSLSEGFGMPVLEGFAANVPVISSNVSSIPEIAEDAALLINPNSINQISKAIVKIISDVNLSKNLIRKGREVIKKYSWSKSAQETLNIYTEILK